MTAALATITDYIARHGSPDDEPRVEALLGDASSLVRSVARLTITRVDDDPIVLDGDGSRRLLLPEVPVIDVTSVSVDDEVLDESAYRWWEWGGLDRIDGKVWPARPRCIDVVVSHGFDPVDDWLVNLVCAMVQRSLRTSVIEAIQSETTGSQTVQYAGGVTLASSGTTLWLTEAEASRVEALRGPVIA